MSLREIFERFNRIARSYAPEFLMNDEPGEDGGEAGEGGETDSPLPAHPAGVPSPGGTPSSAQRSNEPPSTDQRPEAPRPPQPAQAGRSPAPSDGDDDLRRVREQAAQAAYEKGIWTVATACAALGLPATATAAEITRAYRALIIKVHPDRTEQLAPEERERARSRAVALNAAYAFLKEHRSSR